MYYKMTSIKLPIVSVVSFWFWLMYCGPQNILNRIMNNEQTWHPWNSDTIVSLLSLDRQSFINYRIQEACFMVE